MQETRPWACSLGGKRNAAFTQTQKTGKRYIRSLYFYGDTKKSKKKKYFLPVL